MAKKTIKRARIDKKTGQIIYLKKPAYHGSGSPDNLVFWQFGGDFVKINHLEKIISQPKFVTYVWAVRK